MRKCLLVVLIAALGVSPALAQYVIQADFVTPPDTVGQQFTVMVSIQGTPAKDVAGMNFRVGYDSARMSLDSAAKQYPNSGAFSMGSAIAGSIGNTLNKGLPTTHYKVVSDTLDTDYLAAGNLFLLTCTLLSAGPADIAMTNNDAVGIIDSGFAGIPHTFGSSLPVAFSGFRIE